MVRQIEDNAKWGNKFVKNLSIRLKIDFPNMTGFSITNLKTIYYSGTATGAPWGATNATVAK